MEYLPGMSLGEIVDKHGPMPPGRVIHLLRQACGGLGEAHAGAYPPRPQARQHLCRQDRREWDFAKVLDFGLVKVNDDQDGLRLSRENTVQGTPTYMAPEQVLGLPNLDHRVDLYAIGCVAYTLLTGRPPFDEATGIAVMVGAREVARRPPINAPARPARRPRARCPPLPREVARRPLSRRRCPRAPPRRRAPRHRSGTSGRPSDGGTTSSPIASQRGSSNPHANPPRRPWANRAACDHDVNAPKIFEN